MQAAAHAITASPHTALSLFRDEHQRLDWLLNLFRQQSIGSADKAERQRLLARIDRSVRALIALKEAMLYPLLKTKAAAPLLPGLKRDHQLFLQRLDTIGELEADTGAMDMHMEELALDLRRHLAAEERRLFPLAESVDSTRLGQQIAVRRAELLDALVTP